MSEAASGTGATCRVLRCRCVIGLALSAFFLAGCQSAGAGHTGFVDFDRLVIDDEFPGGYTLAITDIDADGRLDVVALASSPARLNWYRNPDWQSRTIETGTESLIDVAAFDITGNGFQDLVLASEFSLRNPQAGGLVSWLENPAELPGEGDMTEAAWQRHRIDRLPASHRLHWADVSGHDRPVLINLPIIAPGATSPDYSGGVRLMAYNIPENPRRPWGGAMLDDSLEMAHGLLIHDWNGDGREQLLTASYSGIDLFSLATRGRFVDHARLVDATETERPAAGISELAVGHSNRADRRFIATIEPWHGSQVVVYRPQAGDSESWRREVIDDSLATGHALVTADLNGDGFDEIIAGGRGEPYSLNIYRYDPESGSWRSQALDGRVAVSGLAVADLTGNGYPDIVAVGAATGNVVIYRNSGR